jgi:hypothetical protein
VKFWANEITRLPGNFRTRDKILILPSDSTGPFRAMGRFEAESPARGHRHKQKMTDARIWGVTLLGETRAGSPGSDGASVTSVASRAMLSPSSCTKSRDVTPTRSPASLSVPL